ncbi:transposase [Lamprobacter modestohalophilus]|uniref:transposase n=1 Tax=Lamprobacter modestohalophilus TaxID=1064514 RepID=UPI002ADECF88|nr:transposase [Lamprobacter modestohalophilus]MEA1049417.1 transposase [Lamprobacter modestohalophilus]
MTQTNLFSWDAIEARSDLDRLQLAIDHLPDERLVQYLEVMRQQGRNDYPVRPMWNALLAGIVFQHASIESLLRELARNPSLMEACGFDPLPIQRKPKPRIVTDPETGLAHWGAANARASAHGAFKLERLALSGQGHRVGRVAWHDQ